MMKRTKNYRFTVDVANGAISNTADAAKLQALRNVIAACNVEGSKTNWSWRRMAVRLRYRGPRKGHPNGRLMCPRSTAYAADVYVYSEAR